MNKIGAVKTENKLRPFKAALEKTFFHLLLITFVGLVSYANTFSVPFQYDDLAQIANNPVIRDLGNFTSSTKGYAFNPRRYIGYFTFALNYRFGGLSVTGYHIVNLAIHLTNAILVYFLVMLTFQTPYFRSEKLKVKGEKFEDDASDFVHHSLFTIHHSQFIALFSALLFVAHPVQTQAVTYIVQRLTSLATLFYLLSVVMYVKGRLEAGGMRTEASDIDSQTSHLFSASGLKPLAYYVLSFFSAILAMKTKEIAFTLPIMILFYEFIFFRSSLKKRLLFLTPVLITLAIIPLSMLRTDRPLGEILSDLGDRARVDTLISRGDYFVTQMRVITTYIRLLLFPAGQNLDYDYPIYHSFFAPPVLLSFLFLLALFGTAVYLLYKTQSEKLKVKSEKSEQIPENLSPFTLHLSRLIAFGIFWFFIALSVESSVLPIVDVIVEHRVYLPSVGFFIAIIAGIVLILKKISRFTIHGSRFTKIVAALFIVVIPALTGATLARNSVWKNNVTLWQDVVLKAPGNSRAHNNLGLALAVSDGSRLTEAIEHYTKALSIDPHFAEALINRAVAFTRTGRLDKAIEDYTAVIASNPFDQVYYWRAEIFEKMGQPDRAIEDYKKAIEQNPSYLEALVRLGVLYGKSGAFDKAVDQFDRAVAVSPGYSLAYANRGFAYSLMGRYDEALRNLDKAVELDGGDADAYVNRGKVYLKIGNKEYAAVDFKKACDLGEQEGCRLWKQGR